MNEKEYKEIKQKRKSDFRALSNAQNHMDQVINDLNSLSLSQDNLHLERDAKSFKLRISELFNELEKEN